MFDYNTHWFACTEKEWSSKLKAGNNVSKLYSNDFIIRRHKICWQPELSKATLYNKILFPQMWKHCPISVCRTPPGGPLCPHLVPLMSPEEERCSSLIVHSIKRWNGKIPSRLLYLDKKYFSADKKNSSTLLGCTHHMV